MVQIGGSLGLAVLVTLALRRAASSLAIGTAPSLAATQGYGLAFRVAALAMFGAALVAFFLVPGRRREQVSEPAVLEGGILEVEPVKDVL